MHSPQFLFIYDFEASSFKNVSLKISKGKIVQVTKDFMIIYDRILITRIFP